MTVKWLEVWYLKEKALTQVYIKQVTQLHIRVPFQWKFTLPTINLKTRRS